MLISIFEALNLWPLRLLYDKGGRGLVWGIEPYKGWGNLKFAGFNGQFEQEGFDYLEGFEARGQWAEGKREGEFYFHYVDSRDGNDYIRQGIFKDNHIVTGTLKGNKSVWKNMNFEFLEGIGKGSYSSDEYEFQGCLKHTGFEEDVHHGKCEFWYKDGEMGREVYNSGVLLSKSKWNPDQDWIVTSEGQFEEI